MRCTLEFHYQYGSVCMNGVGGQQRKEESATWFGGLPQEPKYYSSHQRAQWHVSPDFTTKESPLCLSPYNTGRLKWFGRSRCRAHCQQRTSILHRKRACWDKAIHNEIQLKYAVISQSHNVCVLVAHLALQVVRVCRRTRSQNFSRDDQRKASH